MRSGLAKFLDALLVFELAHVRMPVFLLVSGAGLLAQTGMFALTAKAVGLELPFAVWMVLVPLTRLVALIPVSIADFGLIQAAHVSVLALFGVPAYQSFALSALFAVEGLLIHSTLGSTAFLIGGRKAAPPATPVSFDNDNEPGSRSPPRRAEIRPIECAAPAGLGRSGVGEEGAIRTPAQRA